MTRTFSVLVEGLGCDTFTVSLDEDLGLVHFDCDYAGGGAGGITVPFNVLSSFVLERLAAMRIRELEENPASVIEHVTVPSSWIRKKSKS